MREREKESDDLSMLILVPLYYIIPHLTRPNFHTSQTNIAVNFIPSERVKDTFSQNQPHSSNAEKAAMLSLVLRMNNIRYFYIDI